MYWYLKMVFENILRIRRMREQVKEELEGLPRGDLDQNMLRQAYWALRTHNLGRTVKLPLSKEETLIQATKLIQKDNRAFCPKFDEKIFNRVDLCSVAKKDPEFNSVCFCSIKKTR
ncbi:hypothetical protein HYU07_02085 [Candidatus Woesearchaeota archaeon]|nr:hypothetical protein [Candidatus Woesearchaeota archaeon]